MSYQDKHEYFRDYHEERERLARSFSPERIFELAGEDPTVHQFLRSWKLGDIDFQAALIGMVCHLYLEKKEVWKVAAGQSPLSAGWADVFKEIFTPRPSSPEPDAVVQRSNTAASASPAARPPE